MNGILDSVIQNLIITLSILVLLALVIKILTKKVVVALALAVFFFCYLNPGFRSKILVTIYPWAGVVFLTLAMLFIIKMMLTGNMKGLRKR